MAKKSGHADLIVGSIAFAVVVVIAAIAVQAFMDPIPTLRRSAPWFGLSAQAAGSAAPAGSSTSGTSPGASQGPAAEPGDFRSARTADRPYVVETLAGHWAAVLAWFQPQGKSGAERDKAWTSHQWWRANETARVLVGSKGQGSPAAWITVAPIAFDASALAQDWCAGHLAKPCRVVLLGTNGAVTDVVEP